MKEKNAPQKRLSREEKRQETKRNILNSAQKLFARKGYEGTPIDEIAENAGYSRGAFYSNFKNKEDIMRELINGGFDSDIEQIQKLKGIQDPDVLAGAFQAMGKEFTSHPENLLWMLEFQLSVVRHPELKDSYREQHRKLRESIREVTEEYLASKGQRSSPAVENYADLFLMTLTGTSMLKLIYGEELPDSLFRDIFLTLMKGMRD